MAQERAEKKKATSSLVFPGRKGPLTDIRDSLDGACNRAGVPRIHVHGLDLPPIIRPSALGEDRRFFPPGTGRELGRGNVFQRTVRTDRVVLLPPTFDPPTGICKVCEAVHTGHPDKLDKVASNNRRMVHAGTNDIRGRRGAARSNCDEIFCISRIGAHSGTLPLHCPTSQGGFTSAREFGAGFHTPRHRRQGHHTIRLPRENGPHHLLVHLVLPMLRRTRFSPRCLRPP